jgi:hypothetical protein
MDDTTICAAWEQEVLKSTRTIGMHNGADTMIQSTADMLLAC